MRIGDVAGGAGRRGRAAAAARGEGERDQQGEDEKFHGFAKVSSHFAAAAATLPGAVPP